MSHKVTPLVTQATGNSVEEDSRTLKDILGRMDPSDASQVIEKVLGRMEPSVVADLHARLGYVKEEELKKAHHAALPPEPDAPPLERMLRRELVDDRQPLLLDGLVHLMLPQGGGRVRARRVTRWPSRPSVPVAMGEARCRRR
mgnify:CR=1 FL=1